MSQKRFTLLISLVIVVQCALFHVLVFANESEGTGEEGKERKLVSVPFLLFSRLLIFPFTFSI
jgi:hypothetical protein